MTYYLIRARPRPELMREFEEMLATEAFYRLGAFGKILTHSLCSARRAPDGCATWEELDYCDPPLAQEREMVFDHYFTDLQWQTTERWKGWRQIEELPPLFPRLNGRYLVS